MTWHSQVVAALCEHKQAGVPFERAWPMTMTRYPPRGRDDYRPTLFDGVGEAHVNTVLAFFREACRQAWHDEKPKLRHFTAGALLDHGDDSEMVLRRRAA